jgi:hypothetical protein
VVLYFYEDPPLPVLKETVVPVLIPVSKSDPIPV